MCHWRVKVGDSRNSRSRTTLWGYAAESLRIFDRGAIRSPSPTARFRASSMAARGTPPAAAAVSRATSSSTIFSTNRSSSRAARDRTSPFSALRQTRIRSWPGSGARDPAFPAAWAKGTRFL